MLLTWGAADQYTHDNMVARWVVEKNKWLQVSLINWYGRANTSSFVLFRNRDSHRLAELTGRKMCEVAPQADLSLKVRQNRRDWLSDAL